MYSKSFEIRTAADKTLFFGLKTLFLNVFKQLFLCKITRMIKAPAHVLTDAGTPPCENFLD
jgi:hypothetical protein